MVSDKANAYVRAQLAAATPQFKQQLIEQALDTLEGKKRDAATVDPVKKLYLQYFEQKLYVKEMEQEQQKRAKARK